MTRTQAEFEIAATHIAYELDQMVRASLALQELPAGVLRNACLESFLLHARSLLAFLLFDRRYSTDIHRDDFVGEWKPTTSATTRDLQKANSALNKHLAHLTWERVNRGQQAWEHGRRRRAGVRRVRGSCEAQGRRRPHSHGLDTVRGADTHTGQRLRCSQHHDEQLPVVARRRS